MRTPGRPAAAPSEARLWAGLWPLLLASALSLFPFTVYATFLVPIAAEAGRDVAAVGALRGLGGIAALLVGVLAAPLLERAAKRRAGAAALAVLAGASLVATHGSVPALAAFCVAVGAATAVLTPALLAQAVARYDDPAVSGRAATLVTAAQSLAAVAAGPVIGLLAALAGWRGALAATAAVAVLLAVAFATRGDAPAANAAAPPRYADAFRRLANRPAVVALIAAAGLRTAAFMGCLAYLAAWYADAFALDAGVFTLVWTLSGLAFFLGNYGAGRWIGSSAAPRRAHAAMLAGTAAATTGLLALFWAPALPVALAATALQSAGHAVTAAAITTLIVREGGEVRTAALSVNGAAMSLGVFAGAALGGAGLAVAGYPGLAAALALPLLAALAVAAVLAARRPDLAQPVP